MGALANFTSNSTPSPTAGKLVGWVPESSGRGTLGLLVTCLFTIFLCTWVVIHPRVYKRSLFRRLHKVALFIKTIIAPEFIAVEGLQEWSQAQKMVKNCAKATRGRLKLVHAFYISMLALRYRTPRGQRVIWPNQYTWLLEQGLVEWDDHESWGLSEENIHDKSNADGTAKLFALGQVCWFVAQSIMRDAHNLPLSQLEAMTLSYIPLFAVTYFFWWIKPKDVLTPSVVDLPSMLPDQKLTFESLAVSNAFDDEGLEKQDSLWSIWALTPRVFEKEAEDKALEEAQRNAIREAAEKSVLRDTQPRINPQKSTQPSIPHEENAENTKEKLHRSAVSLAPVEVRLPPKERIVAYWDPELYHSKRLWPITCVFGASFGALHLISWNTEFPTVVELWLWRVAALVSIVSMLIFMQFKKVVVRWGGPLTILSLVSPALYLCSRLAMIGGVIAAFRASNPAIYDTYVVSTYWVHVL